MSQDHADHEEHVCCCPCRHAEARFHALSRADRTANLHGGIGKASFPAEHLYTNLGSFAAAVLNARPRGVKGSGMSGYILAAHLTSTMGRSVPIALPSLLAAIQKSKR